MRSLKGTTQCETEGTWGGIYLFETEASARAWEDHARSLLNPPPRTRPAGF